MQATTASSTAGSSRMSGTTLDRARCARCRRSRDRGRRTGHSGSTGVARLDRGGLLGRVQRPESAVPALRRGLARHGAHHDGRVRDLRARRAGRSPEPWSARSTRRPSSGAAVRPARPGDCGRTVRHRRFLYPAARRPGHPGSGHRGGARAARSGHDRDPPGPRHGAQRRRAGCRNRPRCADRRTGDRLPALADTPHLPAALGRVRRPGRRRRPTDGGHITPAGRDGEPAPPRRRTRAGPRRLHHRRTGPVRRVGNGRLLWLARPGAGAAPRRQQLRRARRGGSVHPGRRRLVGHHPVAQRSQDGH